MSQEKVVNLFSSETSYDTPIECSNMVYSKLILKLSQEALEKNKKFEVRITTDNRR